MQEIIVSELNNILAKSWKLIEQHEKMKEWRKQMGTDELFERLHLNEKVWALSIEAESAYNELKRQLELIKWDRKIELKEEVDDNWKKKYTETTADAVIAREFDKEDKALWSIKKVFKQLYNIKTSIPEYVNIVKMDIKNLTPIQWF